MAVLDEAKIVPHAFDRGGTLLWSNSNDTTWTFHSSHWKDDLLASLDGSILFAGERALLLNPVGRRLPYMARAYAWAGRRFLRPGLKLARLQFELNYQRVDGDERTSVTVDIAPVKRRAHAVLRLPVAGRLMVLDRGYPMYVYHKDDYVFADVQDIDLDRGPTRYSYGLLPVDAAGVTYRGDPDDNTSWVGFGQPVLAPAAGTVIAVVDDRPDRYTIDSGPRNSELPVAYGNQVLIEHGHGEVSRLGHLQHGARSPELARAMNHVLARLGEPLTIASAARAAGVSPRTLARRFAAEARMPFEGFVRAARMLRAMALLTEGTVHVTEVALEVGFASAAAFTRAFTAFVGESPSTYRRRADP